jgi:hypothetical protein
MEWIDYKNRTGTIAIESQIPVDCELLSSNWARTIRIVFTAIISLNGTL